MNGLLIKIEVPQDDGNVTLHYTAPDGMAMGDVLTLFEKAIATLVAEVEAAKHCPFHEVMT